MVTEPARQRDSAASPPYLAKGLCRLRRHMHTGQFCVSTAYPAQVAFFPRQCAILPAVKASRALGAGPA
jgi:hypothetical protein